MFRIWLAVLTAAVTGLLGLVVPAGAQTPFSVVWVTPAGGVASTGISSITLELSGEPGEYSVQITAPYCSAGLYGDSAVVTHAGGTAQHVVPVSDTQCAGSYGVWVERVGSHEFQQLDFHLDPLPFEAALIAPVGGVGKIGLNSITVQITGDAGDYQVMTNGPGCGESWWGDDVDVWHAGGTQSHVVPLSDTECSGWYDIDVFQEDTYEVHTLRMRLAEAPAITSFTRSRVSFWPRVKDGYKDTVTLRWQVTSGTTRSRVVVKNSKGRSLDSSAWTTKRTTSWRWDGRTKSGARVKVGKYRAVLEVEAPQGWKATRSKTLTVKSGMRTLRDSASRTGFDWSNKREVGNCLITDFSYDDTARIDCWGGVSGQLMYDFRIPADAHSVTGWARKDDTLCCDSGSVTVSGDRVRPRKFRVTVRATDWRAVEVSSVGVQWKTTRRY